MHHVKKGAVGKRDSGRLHDPVCGYRFANAGAPYHSSLVFNTTEDGLPMPRGTMLVTWNQAGFPALSWLRFKNTVVDVGVAKDGKSYEWVVEFQCNEVLGVLYFYAFNFYSKTNTMQHYGAMVDAANNAGLAPFITAGNPIKTVRHDASCWYNSSNKVN